MLQLAALAVKANAVNGVQSSVNGVSQNDIPPSQPSGSVAVFLKLPRKKRRKKPGMKPGPKGSHRPPPESVTQHVMPVAMCCPDSGGQLNRRRNTTRKRFLEDIPDAIKPESTEHTIQQDYCPKCRKVVAPVVADAMPGATIGHHAVVLSAFLHNFVGTPMLKILAMFNIPFFFKRTAGGLMNP
jgi:hypothetical protein